MYTTQMVALPMVSALSWVQMSGKTVEAQLRMGQLMLSSGLDALDMETEEPAPAAPKVVAEAAEVPKAPVKPKAESKAKAEMTAKVETAAKAEHKAVAEPKTKSEPKAKAEPRSRKARKAPTKPPAMPA
jgi:hypothetical protein